MTAMGLRTRAVKSTAWYAATRVSGQAVSWVVTIFVARILTPADYGLFAMALTVVVGLELVKELGLGTAIIQRQNLTRPQLNAIFWIVAGIGAGLTAILWSSAGLAAAFYGEPRLVGLLRVLSVIFLLNCLGTVPWALLTKEIDFRRRSLAEASSVAVSAAAVLVLVHLGFGVWSLIFGHLVKAAVRNTMLAVLCRWVPGLTVSMTGIPDALRFGLRVMGSTTIQTLSPVVNQAVVGRLLGGAALGLYSMSDSLARAPHRLSSGLIQQLSLPIFSKLQADERELRRAFLKVAKYVAVVAIPAQIGLALVAEDLVVGLLSEQWRPIIGLFQTMCLGDAFFILSLPAVSVMIARGRAAALLRYHVTFGVLLAGALALGAQFGMTGLAVAWALIFPALRLRVLTLGLAEIQVSAGVFARTIATPALAVIPMIATIVLAQMATAETGHVARLAAAVATGALSYAGALLAADGRFRAEIRTIVSDLFAVSRA